MAASSAYLNPFDGQIEGFDIDMLHAIAAAIFGNPDKIRFVAISDAQRIPAVQSGRVDIVAHTMTITCARWQQVDFSTVYFDATQRVLIPSDSTARSLVDLGGQKVCATTGSTSLTTIRAAYAKVMTTLPVPVAVPYWTDCLVLHPAGQHPGEMPGPQNRVGCVAQPKTPRAATSATLVRKSAGAVDGLEGPAKFVGEGRECR